MASDLPALGNGINYGLLSSDQERALNNLRSNYDAYQRISGGQIGPEVEQLLGNYGPQWMQKAINKGLLDINLNYQNPYIGFTYRF